MDLLTRIKQLVLEGNVQYTKKAFDEMILDGLDEVSVEESIVNATRVRSKRSRSPKRGRPGEKVHIIEGMTFDGRSVYTKGVIRKLNDMDIFYVLVSAKRSRGTA